MGGFCHIVAEFERTLPTLWPLPPFPLRIGSIDGSGLFWCKGDDIRQERPTTHHDVLPQGVDVGVHLSGPKCLLCPASLFTLSAPNYSHCHVTIQDRSPCRILSVPTRSQSSFVAAFVVFARSLLCCRTASAVHMNFLTTMTIITAFYNRDTIHWPGGSRPAYESTRSMFMAKLLFSQNS